MRPAGGAGGLRCREGPGGAGATVLQAHSAALGAGRRVLGWRSCVLPTRSLDLVGNKGNPENGTNPREIWPWGCMGGVWALRCPVPGGLEDGRGDGGERVRNGVPGRGNSVCPGPWWARSGSDEGLRAAGAGGVCTERDRAPSTGGVARAPTCSSGSFDRASFPP